MTAGEIVSWIQWGFPVVAAAVYLLRSLLGRDKAVDKKFLFEIVSFAMSAAIMPFGGILIYAAFEPDAWEWISDGEYRAHSVIIGIGVIAFAVIGLRDNWRK